MKARLSKIIFLVWSLLWAVPAHSLDATSFNPTAVEVTAKATSSIPVGTIISWPVAQNPADWQNSDGSYNWLECNGQSISKTVYPELFALVGGQVPDLRGLFLRGYGAQSHAQNNGTIIGITETLHQSGNLGQIQGDASRKISGNWKVSYSTYPDGQLYSSKSEGYRGGGGSSAGSRTYLDTSRITPTGNENRPVNMAVRYLVRARP